VVFDLENGVSKLNKIKNRGIKIAFKSIIYYGVIINFVFGCVMSSHNSPSIY